MMFCAGTHESVSPKDLLVKSLHRSVLSRYCHALHVFLISHCLKIPTTQQQVHFHAFLLLHIGNCFIDFVQLAMAAALHCNLHRTQGTLQVLTEKSLNAGNLLSSNSLIHIFKLHINNTHKSTARGLKCDFRILS